MFKYLDSVITEEGYSPKIIARIAQKTAAISRLKDKNIALQSKIRLMRSLVMSIFP